jgi:hypothetical protein
MNQLQPGDIIEIKGPHHLSRHIVLDKFIEPGMEQYDISEELMITTYVIYSGGENAPHIIKINKIWNIPLENYLKRSPDTGVKIL